MAEDRDRAVRGLRLAAVTALAAVGASVLYDRVRSGTQVDEESAEQAAFGSRSGRGNSSEGPSRSARQAGYETSDANVRALVWTIIVSVALLAVGLTVVFTMFSSFQRGDQKVNASLTAEQRAPIDPPLPHLQAAPYRDIDAVLVEQSHRLTTYGWDGPDHKRAHIPIQRAMQQVVGQSLDATAQADAAHPAGSTETFPPNPAFNAIEPQHKAPIRMQGEGRPTNVAPSYDPSSSGSHP